MRKKFQGLFIALATFYQHDKLDKETLMVYLTWLLDQGVHGVVACGTTGESLALSLEEQAEVLALCVSKAKPRSIPVVAGIAAPTLGQALVQVAQAEKAKCDGLLVLTPFYVKPSQEALLTFYKAVHAETSLPIILYNNPSRAGVELAIETVAELAASCHRIVALKDSSPDLTRPLALRRILPQDFSLLSGDDPTFAAFLAHGGDGIISVAGGLAPQAYRALYDAWTEGDLPTVQRLTQVLSPLAEALFQSTSPGPLKTLLSQEGWGEATTRLPISTPTPVQQKNLQAALMEARTLEGSLQHQQALSSLKKA
ncbi:MAG: 4-hydroxy-tetrahydrodipicolinate synthase [Alphaproteobacteria bacterium]